MNKNIKHALLLERKIALPVRKVQISKRGQVAKFTFPAVRECQNLSGYM
jgi:hypothetical protein